MAQLTDVQIIQAIIAGGWPAGLWPQAFATIRAESQGDPSAINPSSGAAGLFQILPGAHPEVTPACALNPACNSQQAYRIYKAQGWGAWRSYGNTAWSDALKQFPQALQSYQSYTSSHSGGGIGNPLTGAGNLAGATGNAIGDVFGRVGNATGDAVGGVTGAITGVGSAVSGAISGAESSFEGFLGGALTRLMWVGIGLVLLVLGFILVLNPGQNIATAIKQSAGSGGGGGGGSTKRDGAEEAPATESSAAGGAAGEAAEVAAV